MGTIIVIIIVLFIIASLVGLVINKRKENNYEDHLTDDVIKTKKLYKGSVARYIDIKEALRQFS